MKNVLLPLAILFTTLLSAQIMVEPASPPVNKQPEPLPDSAVYSFAETMPYYLEPTFAAWNQYINNNIQYPDSMKQQGKQGTVYVGFIVEKNGSVTNVQIKKGVVGAEALNREAMRVIAASPMWVPGTMNGKAVRVSMIVPIKFQLIE